MKIASIIYNCELVNHKKVDYINYIEKSVCLDQIKQDIPILYVGWGCFKDANKYNKTASNVDILNKEVIPRKVYWEFSFEEKKSDHINGVEDFVLSAPLLYFTNKYVYKPINPIFLKIKNVDDFKKLGISESFDVFLNYKNEMIYLLDISINENIIYGIDLELLRFLNINENIIIDYFKRLSSKVIEDFNGEKSEEGLSYFNSSNELIKYLPVILNK